MKGSDSRNEEQPHMTKMPYTLPMTIEADACLTLTLSWLRSRLSGDDLESVHKMIKLYGDLRVIEFKQEGNTESGQAESN